MADKLDYDGVIEDAVKLRQNLRFYRVAASVLTLILIGCAALFAGLYLTNQMDLCRSSTERVEVCIVVIPHIRGFFKGDRL